MRCPSNIDVARPLPTIVRRVQTAAQRAGADCDAVALLQILPEQWHCPTRGLIAATARVVRQGYRQAAWGEPRRRGWSAAGASPGPPRRWHHRQTQVRRPAHRRTLSRVARTCWATSLIGCPSATSSTASIRRYNRASRAADDAGRSRRRLSVGENRCTSAFVCLRIPASVIGRSNWHKTFGYLLGPERRKTGWMRAEAAGDPGPWRQQVILGRGRWGRSVTAAEPQATQSTPDPAPLVSEPTGGSPASQTGRLARG